MPAKLKLQSAIDFLSAYTMAIALILTVLVIVYKIAFVQPIAPFCTSPPGFSCAFTSLNTTGVLALKISQAVGTPITINGAACADQQNYTGDNPLYGNTRVNGNQAFYPPGYYAPGNTIYSGGSYVLYVYCYKSGAIASGSLGGQFAGYVWLNYSIPNYGDQVQKIATFQAEYAASNSFH